MVKPIPHFSCAEPDMSGVAVKSTGEWDDKQASGKALEVVKAMWWRISETW